MHWKSGKSQNRQGLGHIGIGTFHQSFHKYSHDNSFSILSCCSNSIPPYQNSCFRQSTSPYLSYFNLPPSLTLKNLLHALKFGSLVFFATSAHPLASSAALLSSFPTSQTWHQNGLIVALLQKIDQDVPEIGILFMIALGVFPCTDADRVD